MFPNLALIVHEFSTVSSNGLPDADYNDELLQFDNDIRSTFERSETGQTVLVETFGGKRRYYVYVAAQTDVEELLSQVRRANPKENLSWTIHPDPDWDFLKKYHEQYFV